MPNDEITETLTTSTDEELVEELANAERMVTKRPTFPSQATAPRFLERKQQWREYRELVKAEQARRAAAH